MAPDASGAGNGPVGLTLGLRFRPGQRSTKPPSAVMILPRVYLRPVSAQDIVGTARVRTCATSFDHQDQCLSSEPPSRTNAKRIFSDSDFTRSRIQNKIQQFPGLRAQITFSIGGNSPCNTVAPYF